jgi:predicted dehydrogenase
MSSHEVRIGVIGSGFIGRVHVDAARRAGARLVAVAASTPERSREASITLGADRVVTTADEVVAADDVDVVHICTPNAAHRPLALAAIDAGKHIVCEKPLAMDAESAKLLADSAAKRDLVAAVPFVYRYHPMVHEARAKVLNGETGPVHLVHGSYLQDWLAAPEASNWRVLADLGGNSRAFADIGSHWCDVVEWVTGHRIVEMSATTKTVFDRRPSPAGETFDSIDSVDSEGTVDVDTEDIACLMFRTDQGAVGSLVASQASPGRKNRLWFEVDGSSASLTFDQEAPEELWLGRRRSSEVLRRDPAQLSPGAARLSSLPAGHQHGYADCFTAFLRDVYATVRGEKSPCFPTFEDGARTALLTDTVLASARTRSWIEVPT